MTKTINISEVTFKEELYPRFNLNDEIVNQYRSSLDKLPPIVVNEDYILVDGYHRLTAYKMEGKTKIEAKIVDIPEEDIFLEAVRRNATHGKQLTNTEKKSIARDLYREKWGEITQEEIADLLSVHRVTVSNWVSDINRKKKEERKERAISLYLDYYNYPTQKEVGEDLGLSRTTISKYVNECKEDFNHNNPPDSLQITTVWDFKQCDTQYGMEGYPGRMPGQVIENLLWYYTKPFDLVVDPMAGGGTTVDVCKKMLRRYIAFDLNPIEEKEIHYHNIMEGIPLKDSEADLVVLDPPYWEMKEGEYTGKEENLANFSLDRFRNEMEGIIKEAKRVLRPGGKVSLIISSVNKKPVGFVDLPFDCYKQIEKYFNPIERVSVPYHNASSHGGKWRHRAKKHKFMFRGTRDLIVGEKK